MVSSRGIRTQPEIPNISYTRPLPASVKTDTTIIKLDWQTSNYLRKLLKDGTLTKRDLLAYYSGEDVKDKFRLIEKEINDL